MNRQAVTIAAAGLIAFTGIGIGVAVASSSNSSPTKIEALAAPDTTAVETTTTAETSTTVEETSSTIAAVAPSSTVSVSTTAGSAPRLATPATAANPTTVVSTPVVLAPTTVATAPTTVPGETTTTLPKWYCQVPAPPFVGADHIDLHSGYDGTLIVTRLIVDDVPQPTGQVVTFVGGNGTVQLATTIEKSFTLSGDFTTSDGYFYPHCANIVAQVA